MANKLKNMRLTSVDLVRNGANQEADICLYKSADPVEATETPTESEIGIFKRFINWLRESPAEGDIEPTDPIEKDYTTFDQINSNRENSDKLWRYTDALTCSIRSIQEDHDLDKDQKLQMMKQSLGEFTAAMEDLLEALCSATKEAPALVKSDSEGLSYLVDDDEEEEDDEVDEIEDDEDFDEIEKFNPYHDSRGRFASAGSAGGAAGGAKRMNIDEETELILEIERELAGGRAGGAKSGKAADNSPRGYKSSIKAYREGYNSGRFGADKDPDFKTMQATGNKLFDKWDGLIKQNPTKAKSQMAKDQAALAKEAENARSKIRSSYKQNDDAGIDKWERELKLISDQQRVLGLISSAAGFDATKKSADIDEIEEV